MMGGMAKHDCTGKVRHPHERAAQHAARWLRRKYDRGLAVYYCRECRGWHVGGAY